MKIIRLEKPKKEGEPLVRITYRNWLGKIVVRDVIKRKIHDEWSWYDTNRHAGIDDAINHFWFRSEYAVIVMNKDQSKGEGLEIL